MSKFPRPFSGSARTDLFVLVSLAVGQAVAAGIMTFATRNVFISLSTGPTVMPLVSLCAIALGGICFAFLRWIERIVAERTGQEFAAIVREKIFTQIARMSLSDLKRFRSGGITLRFVGDLASLRNWVSRGYSKLLSASIVVTSVLLVLFLLNPIIAISISIVMLISIVIMFLLGTHLSSTHLALRQQRSKLAMNITERLPQAPELALLGRFRLEYKRLKEQSQKVVDAAVHRQHRTGLLRSVPDLMQALTAAIVLTQATYLQLSTADTAAALAALGLLVSPIRDLAGVYDKYAAFNVAKSRCERILQTRRVRQATRRTPISIKPNNAPLLPSLRFEKVSFQCLRDLDMCINSGKKIGITGPSGSGKSTLLLLASGLEVPKNGQIQIGTNTFQSMSNYKEALYYSGDRAPIVAGSLRRALTLGCQKRPDDKRIISIANQVGLDTTLQRLGGLNGRVSENASNLASGEMSKLLLARYALSDAAFLVLDEPDNNLDFLTRRFLNDHLIQSTGTTLIASQYWQTLRQMDEIWYLDEGRIIESGAPEALLMRNGPTSIQFREQSLA